MQRSCPLDRLQCPGLSPWKQPLSSDRPPCKSSSKTWQYFWQRSGPSSCVAQTAPMRNQLREPAMEHRRLPLQASAQTACFLLLLLLWLLLLLLVVTVSLLCVCFSPLCRFVNIINGNNNNIDNSNNNSRNLRSCHSDIFIELALKT